MAITIEQRPLYKTLPVGQDIIFTVKDDTVVANQLRVKFIAEVYISDNSGSIVDPANLAATLKTTPNNAGVSIFNFRQILESYVSADNLPNLSTSTKYKNNPVNDHFRPPIHIIDKYSIANKSIKWVKVLFKIQYKSGNAIIVAGYDELSDLYLVFNGYVTNEEPLASHSVVGFGYNIDGFPSGSGYIQTGNTSKFLTNAPTTQYAQLTDYGTLAMFNMLTVAQTGSSAVAPNNTGNSIYFVSIKLYDSAGVLLGTPIQIVNIGGFGGYTAASDSALTKLLYIGCYPANLNNWSTDWDTHKANVSYYTIQAFEDAAGSDAITQEYTINIINECTYEPIRLTWLNKLGAWDYYTFMKKSVKSIKTKGVTYTQLGGTWNESTFKIDGYKGGKKSFRVNAKESIKINTDFVTEQDAVWFEELMNSPEIYILNGYSTDLFQGLGQFSGIINKYIQPVLLTTSSYIRKTRANDKLIQYTFEIERNKDNRTQTS